MLAFHNAGNGGTFGGALSDPMPVEWVGRSLRVQAVGSDSIAPAVPTVAR